MQRTLTKQLTTKITEKVLIKGFVDTIRKMGKLTFFELRDRYGKVQCVTNLPCEFSRESVLSVIGQVNQRNEKNVNDKELLGTIEVWAEEIIIESLAKNYPFEVNTDGFELSEDIRLEYRYLDIRRPRMLQNLIKRSDVFLAIRNHLASKDFIEVETPILTQATMEGSRNFIVPSRHNKGEFYALPQSPQQYKQLLMVGGIEKYYQLAKCFRDEDLRADRGFEFTQLDIEMSYVTQEDVMDTIENLVKTLCQKFGNKMKLDENGNFPKIEYKNAITKYGADKFDMRSEEEKSEGLLAFAWVYKFPFFKKVDKEDIAEVRDGKSGWTFTHNPFSRAIPEHTEWHLKGENIGNILTTQYDLVCNGYEIGGGSIRSHTKELLEATYRIMGYDKEQTNLSIGHMLKAFEAGTPPHGGIALGMDRLLMVMNNEKNLKEVMPFPMTAKGKTAIMDGPTPMSEDVLKDYGLKTK